VLPLLPTQTFDTRSTTGSYASSRSKVPDHPRQLKDIQRAFAR
jgi:hypothetical protein